MKSLKILLIISAILFLTTQSRAQSITSGDVTGTVTDATGGSVPNATVELINPATIPRKRPLPIREGLIGSHLCRRGPTG